MHLATCSLMNTVAASSGNKEVFDSCNKISDELQDRFHTIGKKYLDGPTKKGKAVTVAAQQVDSTADKASENYIAKAMDMMQSGNGFTSFDDILNNLSSSD